MSSVLANTHAAFWCLFQPSLLSAAARDAFSRSFTDGGIIYVSSISLIEIRYLVEKGRLPEDAWQDFLTAFRDPLVRFEVLPVDFPIASAIGQIPRESIPDLPDRVIATTALVHNLPLVTKDRRISLTQLNTIW